MNEPRASSKVKAQRIAKASPFIAVFSIATMLLGAFSWILVADRFGASMDADLLFWGALVPGMLGQHTRGALNLAFVPSFAAVRVSDGDEVAWKLASSFATVVLRCAIGFTVVYALLAPTAFRLITDHEPQHVAEFGHLTRILAPILVMWVSFALVESLLYCYQHYTTTSFSTMISNTGLIAGVLLLGPTLGIAGAAWGLTAGYVVQTVVPALRLLPYRSFFRKRVDWDVPGMRDAIGRLGPIVLFSACMMGGFGIAYAVSARLGEGRVSAFRYCSQLLVVLPALVNSAVVSPLYARMAEKAAQRDHETLRWMLQTFVRMVFFLLMPFVVLLMVLRIPIIQTLFEHGKFTPESTRLTGLVMLGLAPCILPMTFNQLPTYLAISLGKAKQIGIAGLILLPIMGWIGVVLSRYWDVAGISFAFTLDFWVTSPLLYLLLRQELGKLGLMDLFRQNARTLMAGVLMGLVIMKPAGWITDWLSALATSGRLAGGSLTAARFAECAVLGSVGLGLYALLARALGVREATHFGETLRQIRGTKSEPGEASSAAGGAA